MAGFVAVLAAMAVVGGVFYLAVFALAGAVSFGESDLAAAVVGAPGAGH
ncbi:MAG: hypothetical protein U5K29_07340 [Acidimicrobiales bacterium]|nr:hypothetical protein [Acidimicrobiales bacterium]